MACKSLTVLLSDLNHNATRCKQNILCVESDVIGRDDSTILPAKSDSDVMFCLQLLSKTLNCTHHLGSRDSKDLLCINPILWIGLIHT